MKKVITILVGLTIVCIASPAFTTETYQHQAALCASVTDNPPSNRVLQQLGIEFFEQESVRTVTTQPLEVRSAFTKEDDNRIYLVSRWHDFDSNKTYTFNCQWIDPDGQAYTTSSASLETPDELAPGIYFTYTAYLDLVGDLKEGEWTVQVFLNGEQVEARNLTIQ
jgi:hypothetical protein